MHFQVSNEGELLGISFFQGLETCDRSWNNVGWVSMGTTSECAAVGLCSAVVEWEGGWRGGVGNDGRRKAEQDSAIEGADQPAKYWAELKWEGLFLVFFSFSQKMSDEQLLFVMESNILNLSGPFIIFQGRKNCISIKSCSRWIKISCCFTYSTFSFCNAPKYFPRGTHLLLRGFSIHVTVQKHNCLMIWYYRSILKRLIGGERFVRNNTVAAVFSQQVFASPPMHLAPAKGPVCAALSLYLLHPCAHSPVMGTALAASISLCP